LLSGPVAWPLDTVSYNSGIQSPFATPADAGHHRRSSNVCTRQHPHGRTRQQYLYTTGQSDVPNLCTPMHIRYLDGIFSRRIARDTP